MMAEKEFSCIKQIVKTVQIPLPATFISNETSGIAEILESWKRQYVKQLQGVVVNYKRYSLSSQTGFIPPNKPFIYYNVRATFDLFSPKVGDIVKGRINRISKEHVGCLIEDTINVTIHLSRNVSQEVLQFINLNREILFEISYFNYDRKIIRVTGIITPKCIQLMKDLFPPETFSTVDTPELSNTDEGIGTSSESTDDVLLNRTLNNSQISNDEVSFKKPLPSHKKSKKHKRDRESSVDTSEVSTSDEMPKKKKKHKDKNMLTENLCNINHTNSCESPKEINSYTEGLTSAKKHKKKRKSESSSIINESTKTNIEVLGCNKTSSNIDVVTVADMVDSSANKAAKLSKKRKRESLTSKDSSDLSPAEEMPKKKVKRKDKDNSHVKKEINDLFDTSIDDWAKTSNADLQNLMEEISPSLETVEINNTSKMKKKKSKDKKSKEKDKSKKKKGKVIASGAVCKKDKKSNKKNSKKNKLDSEETKKHKKSKSHKDKSEKKKKSSKSKLSDVIQSGSD